jgi:HEAT repeat protein
MFGMFTKHMGRIAVLAGLAGACLGSQLSIATTVGEEPRAAIAAGGAAATPAQGQTADRENKDRESALISILQSDASRKDKADACRALALVGTRNAVEPLSKLLSDEKLSHMARFGLEPIPDPSVDDALRAALKTLKGRVLVGAIGSIGVRRDAKAVEPLSGLLKDSDHEVAHAAARALGLLGTPAAARALEGALEATAPADRPAVYEGLFRCAEARLSHGKQGEAVAIYERLNRPDAPPQVRESAARKIRALRQPEGPRL